MEVFPLSLNARLKRSRCGFTIIELLTVVAVISILISLLLPAIQMARESARRVACVNNLKQIGIAMHAYHDAHSALPPGNRSTAFGTWALYILPHLDLAGLYNQWNFEGGAAIPGTSSTTGLSYLSSVNFKVAEVRIRAYTCPSDTERTSATTKVLWIPHHNYAANYGNSTLNQQVSATGVEFKGAPFGNIQTDPTAPPSNRPNIGCMTFADISDGLSQTLLVSEIIQGSGYQFAGTGNPPAPSPRADLRGRIIGYADGGYFMTMNPPNTPLNDYENTNYCIPPTAPLYPGGLVNTQNPPCDQTNEFSLIGRASRSRHLVGVNSLHSDGSVHFHINQIDQHVWQGLGSSQGGEVVSN